ncbi:hypothetical protein M0804_006192 [Polistes exclamans]|nr:hypothetical protein M0804_006192 [Polistes exclamans]
MVEGLKLKLMPIIQWESRPSKREREKDRSSSNSSSSSNSCSSIVIVVVVVVENGAWQNSLALSAYAVKVAEQYRQVPFDISIVCCFVDQLHPP